MKSTEPEPEPEPTVPPKRKRIRRVRLALVIVAICAVSGTLWFLNSSMIREHVRRTLVAELESDTGGRVELSSLRWDLWRLEAEADNLTIHGLEVPPEVPYAHADHVYVKFKIFSFWGRRVGLREVSVDHPVIHLLIYPDGTTNQPTPKVKGEGESDSVQQLFDLAIDRAECRNGWFIVNDRRTPLDGGLDDVRAEMLYRGREKRYDAHVRVGRIDVRLTDLRPFAAQAEADFSIFRDHTQVHSLRLRSGATRLDARGLVTDYAHPFLNIAYRMSVDLAEVARITRTSELRGGTVDVDGTGNFAKTSFNATGKVTLMDGSYSDPDFTVRSVNAGFDYYVDPDRLAAPHIFAHLLGGVVRGEAQILNWRKPEERGPHSRNVKRVEEQGRVDLNISGTSLNAVFAALSNPNDLPLDTLNVVGALDGKVNVSWNRTPRSAVVGLDVRVVPPVFPPVEQLPVSAHAVATYHASGLKIEHLDLATPKAYLSASGTLGVSGESVRVTADTKDLGEIMPLIDALRPPGAMAVQFRGEASFSGSAYGRLGWPTFDGLFEAQNFGLLVPKPAKKAPADQAQEASDVLVVWDTVAGDVVYDSTHAVVRHSVLRRGNSELRFDGNTQLKRGKLSDEFPLTAHLMLRHGDVGDLQKVFGYSCPVDGKLDADIKTDGPITGISGGGHIALTDATAYGEPIKSLAFDVQFKDKQVKATNVTLNTDLGDVGGNGDFNFDTSAFRFELHGSDLKLERIRQLKSAWVHTSGRISFTASGSGTPQEPVVNAQLRLQDLVVNQQAFGGLDIDAKTHGTELRLTARSQFKDTNVSLDGEIRLRGDMPGHGVLTLSSSNLNPLLAAFLPARMTGPTALSARVEASGPMASPEDLKVDLVVDRISGELEKIGVRNEGPIHLRMANREVSVEQFRMGGEGNRFLEVHGKIDASGQNLMALTATGSVNLKLLQTLNPNVMSSGVASFDVAVAGTIAKPAVDGQIRVQNAGFNYIDLPNGLNDINGTLVFNSNRLQVQKLTARTGGGLLDLGGFILYDRGIAFSLTASGRDIRIRYPAGVSSSANADLALTGTLKAATLTGEVSVTRFGINPEFDFGNYLTQTKGQSAIPNVDSPLNNIRLDVHVVSAPELQLQTSLAKIAGNMDLRVRGTALRPSLLGRVNIVEGELALNGVRYHLERGDISFANPIRIEPVLNLEATASLRQYDITLEFHGAMDKLKTNYRSDPPLPTGDIIALLALGRTRNETENAAALPGSQQQALAFTESSSNALLGQALNATVSSRMQKIFGVSRIKFDPQDTAPSNNARVTIEQQVSNNVTLTYTSNFSQSAQQAVQLEYTVNRNVSLITGRDQNGIVSFEVRIRQRKK